MIRGFFGVASQEIFGGNLVLDVASQEIICNSGRQQIKSLTKISTENALEYLASGKVFNMDRLTGSKS